MLTVVLKIFIKEIGVKKMKLETVKHGEIKTRKILASAWPCKIARSQKLSQLMKDGD